mmetsp:Transcript_73408/g.203846  ORF Transcript_73408/g.203846 Transcript_73408/m.203846 type:complete len:83 (-) Transcript_73408:1393-1641(-)
MGSLLASVRRAHTGTLAMAFRRSQGAGVFWMQGHTLLHLSLCCEGNVVLFCLARRRMPAETTLVVSFDAQARGVPLERFPER